MFKTSILKNGDLIAFYSSGSELTIKKNGDYFCTSDHNLCFVRPSHSVMIKALKPKGKNITADKFYSNN